MQDESLQTELKKRVTAQECKDKKAFIETVLISFGQELKSISLVERLVKKWS